MARRIEIADERADVLEIRYLQTCQTALVMCELLGNGIDPPTK